MTPEQLELANTVCGYFSVGCFFGSFILHLGSFFCSRYYDKKIEGLRQCLKELQTTIKEPDQGRG